MRRLCGRCHEAVHYLQAYECLAILEGTSSMAQQALENNAKLKRDDTRNISAYFNKVCASLLPVIRQPLGCLCCNTQCIALGTFASQIDFPFLGSA